MWGQHQGLWGQPIPATDLPGRRITALPVPVLAAPPGDSPVFEHGAKAAAKTLPGQSAPGEGWNELHPCLAVPLPGQGEGAGGECTEIFSCVCVGAPTTLPAACEGISIQGNCSSETRPVASLGRAGHSQSPALQGGSCAIPAACRDMDFSKELFIQTITAPNLSLVRRGLSARPCPKAADAGASGTCPCRKATRSRV